MCDSHVVPALGADEPRKDISRALLPLPIPKMHSVSAFNQSFNRQDIQSHTLCLR
jgi:hypothetical protein